MAAAALVTGTVSGGCGALMAAMDWGATALGPRDGWCAGLCDAVATMLGSAQPMLVAWGPDLTAVYNDAFVPLLGARHPALGRGAGDLWGGGGRVAAAVLHRRARVLVDQEVALPGRAGWFCVAVTPLRDDSGAVCGVMCAAAETTGAVLARRERAAALAAELHAARKLDALGQLAGGVAHDFNNLLTPVVAGLDLLRRRHSEPGSLRLIDAALGSAERAKVLVARLLGFARRRAPEVRAVDVGALVVGMRDLLERSLGAGVVLETALDAGVPPVLADPDRLELALLNLVVNARDAMPGGGTVRIVAQACGASVRISVVDDGCGMDAETVKRAAEPFFSTKSDGHGTGLGLASVKGFAAEMGGGFGLASQPGDGTTVWLELPAADGGADAVAPVDGAAPPAPVDVTVLVVDDDAAARASVAEMLRELGYGVTEASGPGEALERVRGGAPDVLVTDQVMPGMTGTRLAAQVRAARPDLPVLLMTGGEAPESPEYLKLSKPLRHSELARAMAELLRKRRNGGAER